MSNEGGLGRLSSRLRKVSAKSLAQVEKQDHLDKQLRQRQALEINDNIVQGLTVAKYAMDAGDNDRAKEAVERTLKSARQIVTDLLNDDAAGDLKLGPGDLIRLEPATVVLADPD